MPLKPFTVMMWAAFALVASVAAIASTGESSGEASNNVSSVVTGPVREPRLPYIRPEGCPMYQASDAVRALLQPPAPSSKYARYPPMLLLVPLIIYLRRSSDSDFAAARPASAAALLLYLLLHAERGRQRQSTTADTRLTKPARRADCSRSRATPRTRPRCARCAWSLSWPSTRGASPR